MQILEYKNELSFKWINNIFKKEISGLFWPLKPDLKMLKDSLKTVPSYLIKNNHGTIIGYWINIVWKNKFASQDDCLIFYKFDPCLNRRQLCDNFISEIKKLGFTNIRIHKNTIVENLTDFLNKSLSMKVHQVVFNFTIKKFNDYVIGFETNLPFKKSKINYKLSSNFKLTSGWLANSDNDKIHNQHDFSFAFKKYGYFKSKNLCDGFIYYDSFGEIIGYFNLVFTPNVSKALLAEIGIYTKYRGKGLSKLLIKEITNILLARRIKNIVFATGINNAIMRNIAQKIGYSSVMTAFKYTLK
jgi:RimJ/RimL family protein N-acetyltransferase